MNLALYSHKSRAIYLSLSLIQVSDQKSVPEMRPRVWVSQPFLSLHKKCSRPVLPNHRRTYPLFLFHNLNLISRLCISAHSRVDRVRFDNVPRCVSSRIPQISGDYLLLGVRAFVLPPFSLPIGNSILPDNTWQSAFVRDKLVCSEISHENPAQHRSTVQ